MTASVYYGDGILDRVKANLTRTDHISKTLHKARIKRVHFDVNNPEHRAAYKIFIDHGRWVMQFYNEWPYPTVTQMIERKLVTRELSSVSELAERMLAARRGSN